MSDEGFSGLGSPPEPEDDDAQLTETESPSGDEEQKAAESKDGGGEDESEEFRNALKQCGGDKAELGRRFFKNQDDAATLARDRETLLEAASRRPDEKEPEPEPTPELERNTRRMEALKAKITDLDGEKNQTLTAVAEARNRVSYLKGRLEQAEDIDKPEWQSRLEEAKRTVGKTEKEYRKFGARRRELDDQLEERTDERKQIEESAKAERASRRQAEEENARILRELPAYVDSLIDQAAKKLSVPKGTEVHQDLWETVNAKVAMDLSAMRGQGVEKVNMPALVEKHVKRFAKTHDLGEREEFARESEGKRAVRRQPSRGRSTEPEPEPRRPKWQEDERDPKMQKARDGIERRFQELGRM
jgi:chromosome segregation ATPase